MRILLLRIFFLLLGTAGVSEAGTLPRELVEAMRKSSSMTLMTIDPSGKPWWFHRKFLGHRVFTEITVTNPEKLEILRETLLHGLKSAPQMDAKCGFWPRHALVFDGPAKYEWLICYECGKVLIYKNGVNYHQQNLAGTSESLDRLIKAPLRPH